MSRMRVKSCNLSKQGLHDTTISKVRGRSIGMLTALLLAATEALEGPLKQRRPLMLRTTFESVGIGTPDPIVPALPKGLC
jgi:hypothetical protein